MFDENFSFLSSHANTEKLPFDECVSSDVSPFTSQTCSPRLYPTEPPFPVRSTQALPQRDARYNYYPSHPSITALTAQLESQVLEPDSPSLTASSSAIHPTSSLSDFNDEGFVDSPSSLTSSSDLESEFSSTLWDLSTAELNITSSPRSSISLEASALPSFAVRRRQRQALVRLQCLAQRAPDLMMLIEECHPSSIPLSKEPSWSPGSRAYSPSGSTSGRVEKDRPTAVVKKNARMRKRTTTR